MNGVATGEDSRAWLLPALIAAGSALLGALIGGFFLFLATLKSAEASLDQQARSFEQEELEDSRQQRVEVYHTFLEAANAYAVAASRYEATFECDGDNASCGAQEYTEREGECIVAGLTSRTHLTPSTCTAQMPHWRLLALSLGRCRNHSTSQQWRRERESLSGRVDLTPTFL